MTWFRTIMYTPAVTIVAAWMSALTGVDPPWRLAARCREGLWADSPTAPTRRQTASAVAISGENLSTWANTFV